MLPTVGRMVLYRSRTGAYVVPAFVTATTTTLNPAGVEAYGSWCVERDEYEAMDGAQRLAHGFAPAPRGVPGLTSDLHVHLHVLTPGLPGQRAAATDFVDGSDRPVGENIGGAYQEWDVPPAAVIESDLDPEPFVPSLHATIDGHHPDDPCAHPPGTWAWPARS